MKYTLATLLAVLVVFAGLAQEPKAKKQDRIFTKSYGLITATNTTLLGGIQYRITRTSKRPFLNRRNSNYFNIEVVNFRDPKENPMQTVTGSRVTLGKTNYFFVLRPEIGKEFQVFNKNDNEGIGLSFLMAAGPSLGYQKPYYIKWDEGKRNGELSSVPYNPVLHSDDTRVRGGEPFYVGLWQALLNPGLHVKTALDFDISTFRENSSGIEVGVITEAFRRRPEIMAYSKSPFFFVSPYLTLYFGSKRVK